MLKICDWMFFIGIKLHVKPSERCICAFFQWSPNYMELKISILFTWRVIIFILSWVCKKHYCTFFFGCLCFIASMRVYNFDSSPKVVYEDYQMVELTAPYIAGFLAFREADFLVGLVDKLRETRPEYIPDVSGSWATGYFSNLYQSVLFSLECIRSTGVILSVKYMYSLVHICCK